MLHQDQPYHYDLYPPLRPEACPLCGARLQGDEPLCGQVAFPAMGLPPMSGSVPMDSKSQARWLPQRFGLTRPVRWIQLTRIR